MTPPRRFADYGLRDRKRARTRVALTQALLAELSERSLEEVRVQSLCEAVEISPATFFNYFPSKQDLVTHYVQLWSLKMGLVARREQARNADPLQALEALYLATAQELQQHPRVMMEIIAHQARLPARVDAPAIERVERLLFLEDAEGVDELPDKGLGQLLPDWIGQAVHQGLLPPSSDVQQLSLMAASVFFGVPLLVGKEQPEAIGPLYAEQLQLTWAGARARWAQ